IFQWICSRKSRSERGPTEQVIKVNSHTGPKPLSLMEKADAQEGHDFLNGLLNVAKDVGKVIEQHQNGTDTSSCDNTTQHDGFQLTQEDIAKIASGVGSFGELKDELDGRGCDDL
ncbi:hypothetical protein OSTOST_12647, partial [Ostertagia ostertagi]